MPPRGPVLLQQRGGLQDGPCQPQHALVRGKNPALLPMLRFLVKIRFTGYPAR